MQLKRKRQERLTVTKPVIGHKKVDGSDSPCFHPLIGVTLYSNVTKPTASM
jgi:hypothetical protein